MGLHWELDGEGQLEEAPTESAVPQNSPTACGVGQRAQGRRRVLLRTFLGVSGSSPAEP